MAKIILNVDLNSAPAKEQLKSLQNAIQSIATTLSNVKADKNLTAQINALTKNYTALANAAQKVTKVNNQNAIAEEKLAQAKEKTRKATADANTAEEKTTQARIKSQQATEKHTQSTEKNTKSVEKNNNSFIKGRLEMTAYLASVQILQSAFTSLNQTLVETEDATIALQRVLPEGSATNQQIIDDLYEMSQIYGQAFEGVQQATQNFAKAGLDYEESLTATKAALIAVNVAELDVTQATEGMIAIMTQFGYTAEDLMDIVDMLNKVGDQYAVSSEKLLTALQRTGSSAANANLSLEETIGLVTSLSEATGRSGENIGTAVNSLIQYSRKASSLDVFASLSEDAAQVVEDFRLGGATILDVWEAVADSINGMTAEQENLLNEWLATDEMQSLTQELHDELGDIFETTQDVYGTANTYRQNYFISLLSNMDTVQEATETALNSQGYSIKENEKYMQTYTAQVTALTAQWQHLVSEEQGFLDFKKDLVEFASSLLQIIENTGGLSQLIKEVATFTAIAFAPKIISNIKNYGSSLKEGISYIKNFVTAEKAKSSAMATSTATAQAAASAMNVYYLAIGAVIAAYSIYKTVQANHKQALIDSAEASEEAAEQTRQEGEELLELKKELEETGEATGELTNKFKEHVKDLDYVSDDVKNLTGDYKDLSKAMREAMVLQSTQQAKDDIVALTAAEKLVQKDTILDSYFRIGAISGFSENIRYITGQLTTLQQIDIQKYIDEYEELNGEEQKLISAIETAGKKAYENDNEPEYVAEYYNALKEALPEMTESDLLFDLISQELENLQYVEDYIEKLENSKYSNMVEIVDKYLNKEENLDIGETPESVEGYINRVLNEIEDGYYKGRGLGTKEEAKENFLEYINVLFPDYQIELEKTGDAQVKLSNITDETTESFEKQSEALNTISKSFSTAKNALSEFNQNGSLSGSTLLEIRNQYKDVVPDIDTYINALSKEGVTADEVEQKIAELTMAQAQSAIQTGELSTENINLIAALLKENGVLNANEVAYALVNEQKTKLTAETIDLNDVTEESFDKALESANAILNQGGAAEYTRQQFLDLVAQEKIFNNQELSVYQKVKALNELAKAALGASASLGYNEFIDNYFLEHKGELTTLTEANEAWIQYVRDNLFELSGGEKYNPITINTEDITNDVTNSSSSSQTDEYLESLKDIVELRQSELSLLEKQQSPISEQIAKQYEIKAALQDELNYLVSIGADQIEINNLRGQMLDIDSAIVGLQEEENERIQEQNEQIEEQKEQRKQEYEDRISYLESELSLMQTQGKSYQEQSAKMREIQEVLHLYANYLRSIGENQEDINHLSSDWLDYMEQIQQLQIDYYQSERSLLESQITLRQNQGASIDEIISMYQKQQDLLHQQAEYLRLIGAEQKEINDLSNEWYDIQQNIQNLKDEALQNAMEAATKPIQEEINLREEAKKKEEEQLDIEEKKKAVLEAQKKLLDTMEQRNVRVYNTATGQWEWQSNAKDIQNAKEELENAQKDYDDALYNEQTNLLQEQVDWAEKIYEKIQDGSATDQEIVSLMKFFSEQWEDSDEDGKKFLHEANIILGKLMGGIYDEATGTWKKEDGTFLFGKTSSVSSAVENQEGKWITIDTTKVPDMLRNLDVGEILKRTEMEKNNLINPMHYIQSFTNGQTYNTNSGNTTTYSVNGVNIPANASKELAEVLTKIFDDMKLYGN